MSNSIVQVHVGHFFFLTFINEMSIRFLTDAVRSVTPLSNDAQISQLVLNNLVVYLVIAVSVMGKREEKKSEFIGLSSRCLRLEILLLLLV